ncbi:drug resistance transporter, EmrB/QacA subfamily [Candidatus Protofrankia californiensis]|uniref:Drug resistance transporter, EmrB/QacA subfamily n=2 Tax=Protofrankia TaxID=2994361 RepID=A0A1C3NZL4_9ACTN|nr:drug resistance transporter, EmrB/QacA subfamily [Candidatus Protofrankia californiensis]
MGMVLSAGPVLGLIVGGIVLQGLTWRWMFLVNLPIGIVAFLGALRVVPADRPHTQRPRPRLDTIGVASIGPGFALAVLALSQAADRTAFAVWQVLIPLTAGAALLVGYAIHALRARRTPPLIDLRLFTNPGFAASVTVMTLVGLATFANLFVLPLYYQQQHGYGTLAAGLLVAPFAAAAVVAMPLSGRLSDRLGARSLARGGAVVAALGGLAFTQVGARTDEVWPALAAFVVGLGLGFVGAPTMGSLYRTLPAPLVAQGSSVLYILNQLGAAIGIAVVTLILATAGDGDGMAGFHRVHWFVIGTVAVILAAGVLLPGRPEALADAGAEASDISVDTVAQGAAR